jgi:hypothetical protein
MNFNIRHIGGEYVEMKVDAIETGTMDAQEAAELAVGMINAAAELLHTADISWASSMCCAISDGVTEHVVYCEASAKYHGEFGRTE